MLEINESLKHQSADIERKIIYLMLNFKAVIDELLDSNVTSDFFESIHQPLVDSIYKEYISSDYKRLLTRDAYRQILKESGASGDPHLDLTIYDKCDLGVNSQFDDLGYLKRELIENFIAKRSHCFLDEFSAEVKKGGYKFAALNFVDKLQSTLAFTEVKHTVFASLDELKDDYIKQLKEVRDNPKLVIRCGIPEIDEAVNVGFQPQHLTLFVADVGHHKTNIMLNIALNIFEKGHTVLFIPLEMSKEDLINRIVANRVGISFNKLASPEQLTDDELSTVEKAKIWLDTQPGKFCILDADERTSVSSLKREIEKHTMVYKPKVVIIDYIANLKPDVRFGQRNDLEIGEILKSLCFLGKKYGFHIISAAQMGRAAIKALREGRENAIDSTSIRGSHEYSADATTIFVLMKCAGEDDRLKIQNIKARHGRSGYTGELRVDADRCLISSTCGTLQLTSQSDIEMEIDKPSDIIAKEIENLESLPNVEFNHSNLDLPDMNDDVSEMGI